MKKEQNKSELKFLGREKTNPFRVPESYFKEFETGFMKEHVSGNSGGRAKLLTLKWIRYAAAAMIVSLIITIGIQIGPENPAQTQYAEISDVAWTDMEDVLKELNTDELIEVLSAEEINELELSISNYEEENFEEFIMNEISDEDLESLLNSF